MATTYVVKIELTTPMLQGRQYSVAKTQGESFADYENRTWRERLHTDEQTNVVIPPLMIKNMLRDAAKYLSESVPGKGKSTFTKHFRSGVMVFEPSILKTPEGQTIKADSVEPLWLSVPSDGQTGGTKRVPKAFPEIAKGTTFTTEISVLDGKITREVLSRHLTDAGNFIGLGAMRVANGGVTGRFKVLSLTESK
jgi:hypothetical protein